MRQAYIIIGVVVAALLTACDAHRDFPDTGMKQGHILCTDGKVLSYEDYERSGKTAIAVVFHVSQGEGEESSGYAVYLWNIAPVAFADSIGVAQGTSADITAYDGNGNTFALYDTSETTSPLATAVFDLWRYGQSAYIPSVAQIRLLMGAKDAINPFIEKCGGTPIPDAADDCWYWTSTEVEGQETAKAWLYSLGSGAMQETPKTQAHKARAIISIYQ